MTADLYQRPSRDAIAAKVRGQLPGAQPSPAGTAARNDPPGPAANFGAWLRARMRALGWDQATLQERAGIKTPHIAARAINGTGVDLGAAAGIAALVGLELTVMLGPYRCVTCDGQPPAGFACLECGTEARLLSPGQRLEQATAERTGRQP